MENTQCPYCKEEIKAGAMICKHCHLWLRWSREEVVMATVLKRLRMAAISSIAIPSQVSPVQITLPGEISDCAALCYHRFGYSKDKVKECVDNCNAAAAVAEVAERLHKELIFDFAEIIWGKGDIDPLPLEKAVRERFSHFEKM